MLHLPPWFCEVINPSGHTTSMLNSSEKKKNKLQTPQPDVPGTRVPASLYL